MILPEICFENILFCQFVTCWETTKLKKPLAKVNKIATDSRRSEIAAVPVYFVVINYKFY